ncbi:hypothetical protein, partial [Sorangium cellulosum]|uniref:hypothetical protein n=1 Tax=Sorangium cellulosum TaxID=56 RepID=UPI000A4AD9D9
GIAWAILASVVVVLYAYNGNPRVRVSSDPLALALAASAWAAGARWLLESLALAHASRRAGPP